MIFCIPSNASYCIYYCNMIHYFYSDSYDEDTPINTLSIEEGHLIHKGETAEIPLYLSVSDPLNGLIFSHK